MDEVSRHCDVVERLALIPPSAKGRGLYFRLSFPEERTAVMTMVEEYFYIESYMLGAAQGTFDAIGVPVQTEVILEDRFNGRHVLKW